MNDADRGPRWRRAVLGVLLGVALGALIGLLSRREAPTRQLA